MVCTRTEAERSSLVHLPSSVKTAGPKHSRCHPPGKITCPWEDNGHSLQSQYLAQISYSSFVPRNLKSTGTTSWNPSCTLGSLNRDTKPLKAILGRAWRASGLSCAEGVSERFQCHDFTKAYMGCTGLFKDLTASLCSHSCNGVLNQRHRIGTWCLRASATHWERVSTSGFVLSRRKG